MKVFCFVKKEDFERVAECGITTEEYCGLETEISGRKKKCILGYISPYDSPLIKDESYAPVKIDILPEEISVAENVYREAGLQNLFYDSFVKLSEYKFGSYRKPVCVISGTVLPGNIEKYSCMMDEPLLYTDSEELYLDSMFAKAVEEIPGFKEKALQSVLDVQTGEKITEFEKERYKFYSENGKVIFISSGERQ